MVLTCHCVSGSAQALSLRRLLGQILQGNGSIGNPGFTNPTQPIQAETYFAQIGCAVEQALGNSSAWENTNKQNSFCWKKGISWYLIDDQTFHQLPFIAGIRYPALLICHHVVRIGHNPKKIGLYICVLQRDLLLSMEEAIQNY